MAVARLRGSWLLTACLSLTGCGVLSDAPRPARSTHACAREAVAVVTRPGLDDKRLHCLGAAQIARVCSVAEARMAGLGKELADALGTGDADPEDARASMAGIECARDAADEAQVEACCERGGY